jgi:hypothetical protein
VNYDGPTNQLAHAMAATDVASCVGGGGGGGGGGEKGNGAGKKRPVRLVGIISSKRGV